MMTGFKRASDGAVTAVETDKGNVETDFVVVGAGPWVRSFWDMLELPKTIAIKNPEDGSIATDVPMWVYWSLQEGTLGVDPKLQVTKDGNMPPVIHVDSDAPLYSDEDGSLIMDEMWGIYYKPDFLPSLLQGVRILPVTPGIHARHIYLLARKGEFGDLPARVAGLCRDICTQVLVPQLSGEHPWLGKQVYVIEKLSTLTSAD